MSDITDMISEEDTADSTEEKAEVIQDFCAPMEIIGCDVNALYPSLDLDITEGVVREAILTLL